MSVDESIISFISIAIAFLFITNITFIAKNNKIRIKCFYFNSVLHSRLWERCSKLDANTWVNLRGKVWEALIETTGLFLEDKLDPMAIARNSKLSATLGLFGKSD